MAGESKNEPADSVTSTEAEIKKSKKRKGVISRLWRSIFRVRGDDFEKRLQHLSKEEAVVLARITRRSHSWRRTIRHFIMISVVSEAIAVGYAIMTTRSLDLNWHLRALRVLPMFLLPVLFFIFYSAFRSFSRMRDSKDHKTLENLRAERQAKINELKEKTNYYTTQQLIQRYDTDPAAKAAAATVLASKLGADSGLKVYVGDDSNTNPPTGKSNDVELTTTTGLRNRKNISMDTGFTDHHEEGMLSPPGFEGMDASQHHHPMVVHHHSQSGLNPQDGGWVARLAALLVGEDPTQSYALICGNCHMHNGLARKEDFPYITYYCPHCKALNQPKQASGRLSASNSPTITPSKATVDAAKVVPNEGGSINSHIETTSKLTADAAKVVPPTTVTTSNATVDATEVVPSEGGSANSPTLTDVDGTEGVSTGPSSSPDAGEISKS